MKTAYRTALALATMAVVAQASAQVTFYEREGFQGESFTTRRQIADFNRFGFNDRASSVIVAGESWERWQVCEDVRFGGACAVLQPGQYPNLRAMGLNNRISSVQATARPEVPGPQAGRVVFFERESFGGRSFTTQSEIADFSRNGFNDRISSVEVFGGPWEVCRDAGFAGTCVVLRAGQYPSLSAMGLNNSISSVRAMVRDPGPPPAAAKVTLYEKENMSGRSFTTQGDVPDFSSTGFNDRISSLEVFGGWFEACPAIGYGGACVLLRPGRYPSLVEMGLNNRISSIRATGRDGRVQDNRAQPGNPVSTYDPRRRANEQLYEADVVAVRAVVGSPEQRCWVEREQVVQEQSRSSNVPGAIVGAVIGGILGHQVGDGRGRDLATVGGVIGGGVIGASVGGRDGRAQPATQDVQRCTSTSGPVRAELWDVTYNFRGIEHRVQMTTPPGPKVLVNWDGEPRV